MFMEKFEESVTPMQIKEEYEWAVNTFPALHKYKSDHSIDNLKKLCNEVSDFCSAIYASTRNDAERTIYNGMVKKIKK